MKILTYPFKLGEFYGYVLNDATNDHTAEELIVNPKAEELKKFTQEFGFGLNKIAVGYNNLLLRRGDQNVLVDAGIRRPIGRLCEGLEELKIEPGDIDTIIITHSDRDHIGGILDQAGKISFSNAKYYMLRDSWKLWSSKERRRELTGLNKWTEEKTKFAWESYSKIKDMILPVRAGEEFIPGIRLYPAIGHRYDHSIVKITSSDELLIHLSDSLAHPLFMANREWYSTYDANPTQAVDTKTKLLDICASENALVFAAHFPFPGLGTVQKAGDRWKWHPKGA